MNGLHIKGFTGTATPRIQDSKPHCASEHLAIQGMCDVLVPRPETEEAHSLGLR